MAGPATSNGNIPDGLRGFGWHGRGWRKRNRMEVHLAGERPSASKRRDGGPSFYASALVSVASVGFVELGLIPRHTVPRYRKGDERRALRQDCVPMYAKEGGPGSIASRLCGSVLPESRGAEATPSWLNPRRDIWCSFSPTYLLFSLSFPPCSFSSISFLVISID
jgi:hypothetical protein